MKFTFKKWALAIVAFAFTGQSFGQLTTAGGYTATQLAQILAGPNIVINSATLTGDAAASGYFDGTSSNLGMNTGVILSTGDIANAPGPNNSGGGGDNLGEGGTAQMDGLAGATTFDAVTLEFSFDVESDFIQFQYIFASEEYPEYAPPNSSAFNDVFAFYISGPGIVGEENIALVPSTTNPVTINNINAITNNQYYVDNTGGTTVQYDAWTTVLTAEKQGLTPCEEYTMKLVIADAGDAVWNSAVFLLENSFIQGVVDVNTQTVNADNIALEGCIPAQFNFSLDVPSATDTDITYTIGGTATNGVDYEFIDTVVTIPAGDTTASIIINSIADALPEGQEVIYIIFQPDACSPVDTAFLYIDDAQPIEFTLDGTDLACFDNNSGEILVNATGGFPPYTYHVTDNSGSGTTTQYSSNPITNLPADTYSVQVYDIYGCKAEALLIGGIFDADTTFLPDGTGVSYDAVLNISGFQPGQTLDNMSQLQQVCATMEHSYLGDLQIKIISPSGQEVILKQFNGGGSCDLGEPFASGPVDGSNSNLTDPGVGYEYCFNATPNYGTMVAESNNYTHTIPASVGGTYTDNYLPAGAYTSFEPLDGLLGSTLNGAWTLEVSDQFALDNGYIFNWNISLQSDLPDTLVTISEPNEIDISGFVTQANCGGNDGAIDISVIGDHPAFTYNWSSGQTTEDISGIPAGTYTVYVTDTTSCTDSMTFNLNNISSMNITSSVTQVTCSGGSNGAIDVTTSGGTPPYSFSWSSGQTTEDITGVLAGTYTLTITDANGCVFAEDITVGTIPAINITLNSSTNEVCSFDNGAIDIDVTGGSGSYGYSWDNGATTQDLSNIGAGTYTVTVTDVNGCTANQAFSIINDVSNCSAFCFTNIVTESVTDETCGDGTGAIDITVMDFTPPYIVSWSTGATTDDISGLTAGSYTVTVTDANQCVVEETFTVSNDAGTLNVSSFSVSNENCGNSDGSIDINIAGGTPPYSFAWSTGATTEDVSGLAAGSYNVTITDNSGCSINEVYAVTNNTGTLSESAVVSNEICGNNGGSINLTVTGGSGPYTFNWNTGSTNEDLSALVAGTYTVTITDAIGCTLVSQDYIVDNTASDLQILSSNVTNENCADGAGAIDITVINGTAPYTYSWNSGQTTEDLSGLSAGTYDCTVTDDNGCQVNTGNLIVFNQGGSLSAGTNSTTDEVCGDGTGQIDIQTNGGTAPFTYLWSTGATTEDVTGLSAGSYSVTITDANGCTYDYVESIQNASPGFSVAVTSTTDETCGDGTGAVDITLTGGVGPFTYAWDNGATSQDLTGVNAGSYAVVVTDNNGCEVNTSATVNGAGITIVSANISDEICGDLSGSIDITFTGGVNPYGFSWSNGGTTEDISGLAAGSYDITITGNGGCTANVTYVVGNNTNGLAITNTVVVDENCGDGAGSIDVTTVGGSAPLFYNWDSGQTTEDISGLSAGTYNLTLTDNNGCTVNTSGTVVNNSAGFAASINTVTDETCGDGTGAIDVDVTGGAAPYTYSWDSGQTAEDISGLNAGTYELTVTDNNGCNVVVSATVNNNTGTLSLDNAIVGDADCSQNNGFIDLTISGGTTPYTYLWTPGGETTQDISGLAPGNYSCVITDNSGCILNYSGDVQNTGGGITTNVSITNELCGNGDGSIVVDVTGGIQPFTYSWTGGTPTTCCTYTLDMQDAGNSWNGADIEVLINGVSIGNFTVPGGGSNLETFQACTGDLIELIWTSGNFDNEVSFDLLDPDMVPLYSHAQGTGPTPGLIYTTTSSCPTGPPTQTSLENLSAGTYDLTITDNVGCSITESYTIIDEPSNININITSVTPTTCGNNNGEIAYTVSGGTGDWTTTANGNVDGGIIGLLQNLYQGNWEIITTDDITGCTDTMNVYVGNTTTFNVVAALTDENCSQNDGAINLTVTGGTGTFAYTWSTGATTEDVSGLDEGMYTVNIEDLGDGCEHDTTFTLINATDITLSAVVTNEQCNDGSGSIDLTVTGSTDIQVTWSNGATTEDISGLSSGTYDVSVLNNLTGCIAEGSYTIDNQTTGMSVSANVTPEDCGNTDGEIDVTVTGGVGPFSYSWDTGATSEDLTNLVAGDYTLTVTDQNDGCTDIITYTVLSDGNFNLDLISVTDELCGDGSGAIDIDISGPGTFNPTISWSNGATTEDISGLTGGTYTVDVTNFGGCTMSLTVDVASNTDLTVFGTATDENCSNADGSIDVTVSSGSGATFAWMPGGETTEDITGLSAGSYDVTVTSGAGCVENLTFTVNSISTGVAVTTASVFDELCDGVDGSIDITVGGGVGPYSFVWDTGATTEDISGLADGTYSVDVTDDNDGCTMMYTFVVGDSISDLDISAATVTDELCGGADGAIDIAISGGTGPFTYNWDNGGTTEDLTGLASGDYTITVTDDATGCQVQQTYTVADISTGVAITAITVTDETCGNGDGSIDITVDGGVGPYSYLWTPGGETTEDISGLSAGSYSVTVTDDNDGCSITLDTVVTTFQNFFVTGVVTNSSCATCTTGSIDASVNETVSDGPYTYLWSPGGETTEDLNNLMPGSYTLTVTGASGCTYDTTFVVGNNDDVGIGNLNEDWELNLFPNPSRTDVTLQYNFGSESEVVLIMTDMVGKHVMTNVLPGGEGIYEFGVEEFEAGTYFLNFLVSDKTQTIRMVVTR